MVIGQERHVDVAVAQVFRGKHGPDVVGHVELGQLHGLRKARCARREQNDRQRFAVHGQTAVGGERFRVGGTLLDHALRAGKARRVVHAKELHMGKRFVCPQFFHERHVRQIEIQGVRLGLEQGLLQFFQRQIFVQGHGDAQSAQVGPVPEDPFVAVLADDGQALALHAAAPERGAQGVHVAAHLAERARTVRGRRRLRLPPDLDLERGVVAETVGASVQQFTEIVI